jgi:hypothetical protein
MELPPPSQVYCSKTVSYRRCGTHSSSVHCTVARVFHRRRYTRSPSSPTKLRVYFASNIPGVVDPPQKTLQSKQTGATGATGAVVTSTISMSMSMSMSTNLAQGARCSNHGRNVQIHKSTKCAQMCEGNAGTHVHTQTRTVCMAPALRSSNAADGQTLQ